MKFVAKTFFGLEEVLAEELTKLGAEAVMPLKRAVSFEGDQRMLYRANFELATALRILVPIHEFTARNEEELYKAIYNDIDWGEYFGLKNTFAVNGVTRSDKFTHSKYVALKTKDAIVDQFRDKTGRRPNVNVETPDVRLNIFIQDQSCILSLDSSGDSLHKRGYRLSGLEAPINEVLAAGMIRLSGWKRDCNFIDPMCGSGTILTEAAQYAHGLVPLRLRDDFGFMHWRDFDENLWQDVRKKALEKSYHFKYQVLGFDKAFPAFRQAERNIENAGLEDKVTVARKRFEMLVPPAGGGMMIMNPPYDERLQNEDINEFYKMIGDCLKKEFAGFTAWVISSNMEAFKHVGLRPSRKIPLFNGALECKFQKYVMYEGTKKLHKLNFRGGM